MKKRNDFTLAEAMKAMIEEYRLGSQLNEARVKSLWVERMGKTISTYTSDVTVRRNVLYISILSAPLRQELSYAKEKIRAMMNEALGEEFVKEVVIR
jgi:predicted nucleic acid-binding Zn ribbon protein